MFQLFFNSVDESSVSGIFYLDEILFLFFAVEI